MLAYLLCHTSHCHLSTIGFHHIPCCCQELQSARRNLGMWGAVGMIAKVPCALHHLLTPRALPDMSISPRWLHYKASLMHPGHTTSTGSYILGFCNTRSTFLRGNIEPPFISRPDFLKQKQRWHVSSGSPVSVPPRAVFLMSESTRALPRRVTPHHPNSH